MHATIIGLEAFEDNGKLIHQNAPRTGADYPAIRWKGMVKTIEESFPIHLQFGGFAEGFDGFRSFGKPPFERSFQINWDTGRVVWMGWPVEPKTGRVYDGILKLRDVLKYRHHLYHKYQGDNDGYMVLGTLELPSITTEMRQEGEILAGEIRNQLAVDPLMISLNLSDLSVVRYQSEQLPPKTSETFDVSCLKEERIRALYQGV